MQELYNFPQEAYQSILTTSKLQGIPQEGTLCACIVEDLGFVNVVTSDKYLIAKVDNAVLVEASEDGEDSRIVESGNGLFEVLVVVSLPDGTAYDVSLEALQPPVTKREEMLLKENEVLRTAITEETEQEEPTEEEVNGDS